MTYTELADYWDGKVAPAPPPGITIEKFTALVLRRAEQIEDAAHLVWHESKRDKMHIRALRVPDAVMIELRRRLAEPVIIPKKRSVNGR